MPYTKTLEEGLKLFDEKFPNKIAEVIDDFGSSCKPEIIAFLTSFAEKIREGVVEEVEGMSHNIKIEIAGIGGILNGSAVGDTGQAHTAQMKLGNILKALDDLLAQLKK